MSELSPVHRVRQAVRLLRTEGTRGVTDRLRARVASYLVPPGSVQPEVSDREFEAAASLSAAGWQLPAPIHWEAGQPLKVSWVCTPPALGSGGHTTMFRLVTALMAAGHECIVYITDRHQWDFESHQARIRQGWPDMRAEIRNFDDGVEDCHALFATGWNSAWTILRTQARGLRCYLVQDFEPSFYPAGSSYLLAEATYRFGFKSVTAGQWLPTLLRDQYDVDAVGFDFACDLDHYRLGATNEPRHGVCYYCRPSTPRRAHELAIAALRLFSRRNPGTPIHLYGETVRNPGFEAIQHGVLTPAELNVLYNQMSAGLVLSATNVSLVPHEMLSSGCIPVVNDADQNRLVLASDQVSYVDANPVALAEELERLASSSPTEQADRATAASASVSGRNWDDVGDEFVKIVTQLVKNAVIDDYQ